MGYLLKEALKTLCGVNKWSYAVLWKIGCQNPNLLIWEDCYYEPATYSGLPGKSIPQTAFQDQNDSWISPETATSQSFLHSADKVDSLVNKMMMDNHVKIIGQGLVGTAGFTGNHEWILYDNFFKDTHPPEVCKEMCQQFSAGMQTVAVIPVLPHGVVQFGSYKSIIENVGFVSDVTALVSQLGFVPDVLLSENYHTDDPEPRYGVPVFRMNSTPGEYSLGSNMIDASSSLYDSFNHLGSSSFMFNTQTCYSLPTEIRNDLDPQIPVFQASNLSEAKMKLDISPQNMVMNGVPKAEVIPSNSGVWMKQLDLSSGSSSTLNQNSENVIMSKDAMKSHNVPSFQQNNHLTMGEQKFEGLNISGYDDASQPPSGDDLFDILGADFKNNFFSSFSNSSSKTESPPDMQSWDVNNFHSKNNSEIRSTSRGTSRSGIFSLNETDHLLDAVVSSKANCNQKLDDNLSCRTTLTNTSSSSSLPYGRFGVSEQQLKGELFGVPKYQAKEDSVSYSQSSSIYGSSQVSSWSENLQSSSKPNKSASTGYSKKPDETGKTNRKRLKPGENPRPRPKDRQMIQDRVKELRDIVPNGAKCSIDALLERTIKHMLFLQSVTKHADKLKQTGDSKIINKDGGLLLKDNFEGGATWAYEVGSQSTVCPIVVEDLNQPRQMLIEMLCEEKGLFLEIADIVRGLGLTILKGVMETRSDKIWARFAVEANRDVTRVDIFMSLMRLLYPTMKTGSTSQLPNDENMMVQQMNRGVLSLPMNGSQ